MKIDIHSSHLKFIYPFIFNEDNYLKMFSVLGAFQWQSTADALSVWTETTFPRENLLKHVSDYLNVNEEYFSDRLMGNSAKIWKMEDRFLQSNKGMGINNDWVQCYKETKLTFQIKSVEMAIFCTGVGFLIFSVKPKSDKLRDWIDFNHFFRFAGNRTDYELEIYQRTGKDQFQKYMPGICSRPAEDSHNLNFQSIINSILLNLCGFEASAVPWWEEVYVPSQMIPFVACYIDGLGDTEKTEIFYRIRRFFPYDRFVAIENEISIPEESEHFYCYSKDQWFTFSLDGGAYIAFDAPSVDVNPFFRQTMSEHLKGIYFLNYLIAIHQRFALIKLSEEVCRQWPGDLSGEQYTEQETAFRKIRVSLLRFTARGYFKQITQHDNYHKFFQKWQQIFQVEELYREVNDEVKEMHEQLLLRKTEQIHTLAEEQKEQEKMNRMQQDKQDKWLQNFLSAIAFLLAPPTLLLASIQILGKEILGEFPIFMLLILILLSVFSGVILLMIFKLYVFRYSSKDLKNN